MEPVVRFGIFPPTIEYRRQQTKCTSAAGGTNANGTSTHSGRIRGKSEGLQKSENGKSNDGIESVSPTWRKVKTCLSDEDIAESDFVLPFS